MNFKKTVLSVSLAALCAMTLPAHALSPVQLTNDSNVDLYPQIKSGQVVWQSQIGNNWEIYHHNLAMGTTTQVTNNSVNDINPQTDGNTIVWLENPSNPVMKFYDIASGTTSIVPVTTGAGNPSPPIIANGKIAWAAGTTGYDIYLYDIASGSTSNISNSTFGDMSPKINAETVAWSRSDLGDPNDETDDVVRTMLYDIASGTVTEADETYVWPDSPQIDDGLSVSLYFDGNDRDVFARYKNSPRYQVTANTLEDSDASISGNSIVWLKGVADAAEIYTATFSHSDNDGIPDVLDNCPDTDNPTQLDSDGNSMGDACDGGSSQIIAAINFQPASAPVPTGYLVDSGLTYGDRGNGNTYGWTSNISSEARDRNNALHAPDQRFDTLLHVGSSSWEIALPSGQYDVRLVMGDPSYTDCACAVTLEGVTAIDQPTSSTNRFVESDMTVTVTDGRLTLESLSATDVNKVAFIEISQDDAAPTDTTPNSFVFSDVTGAELNASHSDSITVSGIDTATAISISDGEYRIGSGAWMTAASTVNNGDVVSVRRNAASSYSSTVSATLTIGGVSDVFNITTKAESVGSPLIAINFQPASTPIPTGYLVDSGLTYGDRGNGYSYGWTSNISSGARDRNNALNAPDQRFDTLLHMWGASWEIALPSGQYDVRLVMGDPSYTDCDCTVTLEGVTAIDQPTSSSNRFVESDLTVTVTDGRLTLESFSNIDVNKVAFIEISQQ